MTVTTIVCTVVLLARCALPIGAQERSATISARAEVESDATSGFRVDARVGPSRWLLIHGGVIAPVTERTHPGGWEERQFSLHRPWKESFSAVGASAGPITFGPIETRGLFTRAIDPTAGGYAWGALFARDRFVLDTAIERASVIGLTLAHHPMRGLGLGMWALEGRGGHIWRGASLTMGSEHALPGRIHLLAGETRLPEEPRSEEETAEEGWIYEVPPLRSPHYLRTGAGWRIELDGDPALRLLNEIWGQREGRAPVPWVYNGAMEIDFGGWHLGLRAMTAEPGYRDAWAQRVDRARLLTLGVWGRSHTHRGRIWWRCAWEHEVRWSEGVPGAPRQTISTRLTDRRSRCLVPRRSATVSIDLDPNAERDTAASPSTLSAFAAEPFLFLTDCSPSSGRLDLDVRLVPRPDARFFLEAEGSTRILRGHASTFGWGFELQPTFETYLGRSERRAYFGVCIGVEREIGAAEWSQTLGSELSIPLGARARLQGEAAWDDDAFDARVVFEWRSALARDRGSSAPTESRS